ncbi:MAG: hypothetical protein DMF55_12540 [Acidobacteria bacterium]|nr:MAG: hypothetical protein DMF55_12540 [Acidobacteriota bacterium]
MRSRSQLTSRSRAERADLLVLGGTVVTVDARDTVLADGAMAIRDGAIVAVRSTRGASSSFRASSMRTRTRRCRSCADSATTST